MSDIIIKAEDLGKKYVIGHRAKQERYIALRDVLMKNANSLWQKTKDLVQGKPIVRGDTIEEFWALSGINIDISEGEAVGIIGRNGAGKTTLLKILSRITEPSAGRVTIKGRVASLLEVGTGFHPELTGRENIFLNGSILGMTRREIKRKFDEIVDFSGVEQFIDTPVKQYSSGMYVRLAFAVAAHLEPEILVVDEVLAVGDAAFQKKCLGKMEMVGQEGRTVLFVSHNMQAISRLCHRVILLDGGHVNHDGKTVETVRRYLALYSPSSQSHAIFEDEPSKPIHLIEAHLLDQDNKSINSSINFAQRFFLKFKLHIRIPTNDFVVMYSIFNMFDEPLALFDIRDSGSSVSIGRPGLYEFTAEIPNPLFVPGTYKILVKGYDRNTGASEVVRDCLSFEIADPEDFRGIERPGLVFKTVKWEIKSYQLTNGLG